MNVKSAVAPVATLAAASVNAPAYRRILLKLSGEALMGEDPYGINREVIDRIVAEIAEVVRLGVETAVVIGGGNIFRGVAPGAAGMDRATADYMGMLATLMNALALQDALRRAGVESRVQSALRIDQVAEPYIRGRALRHLEEKKVVIFAAGMDRATADYMGMLATLMNALALQDALRRAGVESRVQSALRIDQVAEPYIRGRALRHLEEKKVVIFAAGTGNPFFTTDTAAALRGREMGVDIVLKATKVDGVYTADPKRDAKASRYADLTFDEAIVRNLKVMDATALALCRDQNMLLKVFSIFVPGALKRVVMGEEEGTLVHC